MLVKETCRWSGTSEADFTYSTKMDRDMEKSDCHTFCIPLRLYTATKLKFYFTDNTVLSGIL